jgi:hypothetical protein
MEERGDAKLHLLSPQMHPAQGRERAGRRGRKGGGGDAGEEETVAAAREKKPSSTAAATTEPPPTRGFFSRAGRRPRARRGGCFTSVGREASQIPARGRGDGWGGSRTASCGLHDAVGGGRPRGHGGAGAAGGGADARCGPRWPRPSSSASIRHLPYTAPWRPRASTASGWARLCPVAISVMAMDLVDCRSESLAGAY